MQLYDGMAVLPFGGWFDASDEQLRAAIEDRAHQIGSVVLGMIPVGPSGGGPVLNASSNTAYGNLATQLAEVGVEVPNLTEKGPPATLESAIEIYGLQGNRQQTVTLLETNQGPTFIGAQPDLTPAQVRAAVEKGFVPSLDLPGVHGEGTTVNTAEQLGFEPKSGVSSSAVCPQCKSDMYKGGWGSAKNWFWKWP